MIEVKYEDVLFETEGALIHDVHPGFKEDYLVLHSLLRRFNPKSIWEYGTNIGNGINVMATACPNAKIYSLDLDYETMKLNSKQYPIGPNGEDRVGSAVKVPYTQLRGDSMNFDIGQYACDAAWVDSEHDVQHPYHETQLLIRNGTLLIIFHDFDNEFVRKGISDVIEEVGYPNYLYFVKGTRIAFSVNQFHTNIPFREFELKLIS